MRVAKWCIPAVILALLSADARAQVARIREPVAVVPAGDELLVANRRSGTISVVNPQFARVVEEIQVGKQLSDLVVARDGPGALVTDEAAGELVELTRDASGFRVGQRVAVASYPVSMRVSDDQTVCTVASLWSRRLSIVDLGGPMRVRRQIDLPFAPRAQWLSPDGKRLVVADAFGGRLGAVDVAAGRIVALWTLQAHNIRGIAASADGRELLIAHQMLDDHTPTEPSRITWGQVVGNVIRAVAIDGLFGPNASPSPRPLRHWSLYPLGGQSRGAGDPAAVVVAKSHATTAVALAGVDEIAIRGSSLEPFTTRIAVGRRPTSMSLSRDERMLFVGNSLDDSVDVIEVVQRKKVSRISLGPRPAALSEEELGERLFSDARLSLDGWYSCQSCHTDGHTSGQRNDNLSDGSFGTPKQIPSLLGVETTRPWGWFGQMQTHEVQVQRSILGTMHGRPGGASTDNVNAIASYIRALPAAPGIAVARGMSDADRAAADRGRLIFRELRCTRCHGQPDFTSDRAYDVGLGDEADNTRFNPPSLLGVSQRDAFLHDGRAASLKEVFERFKHPAGESVEGRSIEDLLAYLRTL